MESVDEVILWKAPQPGRLATQEIVDGFDPQDYPGDGPYFTTDRSIAETFKKNYGNGIQEIHVPKVEFEGLVNKGIILKDSLYDPGISFHVPPLGLGEFNEAIKKGTPNVFEI